MAPVPKMVSPICLIENNLNKRMSVNPQAKEVLEKISQPVVVVSIVGPYRSGKSYLMNKLAGAWKGGFPLGHTVEAKTKGIWMWCVPHPKKREHTLILLDTEGLGDVKKGETQNDNAILSLSMLLSSAMVYNSRGTIDNDALTKMHTVTELSECIMMRSSTHGGEETAVADEECSGVMPLLVWVVRDFSLKQELMGKPITEDEYLENSLRDKTPVTSLKAEHHNALKQGIRTSFPARKCFLFKNPSSDQGVTGRTLEHVPEKELDPGFVDKTKTFCQFILENAGAKTLKGQVLTGCNLGRLVESYVKVASGGSISYLERSLQDLALEDNKLAINSASDLYEKQMSSKPMDSQQDFQALHAICLEEALKHFKEKCFTYGKNQEKSEDLLKSNLMKKKDEIWKTCEDSSRHKCKGLIQRLFEPLLTAIGEQKYYVPGGHNGFVMDKKKIVETYNQEARKAAKAEEVLQEFLKSLESVETIILQTEKALEGPEKAPAGPEKDPAGSEQALPGHEKALPGKTFKRPQLVDPSDSSQLTKYIRNFKLESQTYHRILIQLFGFAGHGKSSFVNSCLYVMGNEGYKDEAGEAKSYGGKTIDRRGYKLTERITIVDNRGFGRMDSSETWEIYAQLCNFVPLNQYVVWKKTIKEKILQLEDPSVPDLIVPVLIYSAEQDFNDQESETIKEFLKNTQTLTGILPLVILTKKLSGNVESAMEKFTQLGIEQIFALENYTLSNTIATRGKHTAILKCLKELLDCVDFLLQSPVDLKKQQTARRTFLINMA
ncbi:guanylate-binding protein 3-like isoform X2 [Ascaphus truei]|uniref:guanylate-binding protein 3-like isoform X2 n=1 Tax=Ascaphus truei TaxID=8439 RepID=UPI003F598363